MQDSLSRLVLELKPADGQTLLAELEAAGIHAEATEQSQMGGLIESLAIAVPLIKIAIVIVAAFLRRKPEARPPVLVVIINHQNFIIELQGRSEEEVARELESLQQRSSEEGR